MGSLPAARQFQAFGPGPLRPSHSNWPHPVVRPREQRCEWLRSRSEGQGGPVRTQQGSQDFEAASRSLSSACGVSCRAGAERARASRGFTAKLAPGSWFPRSTDWSADSATPNVQKIAEGVRATRFLRQCAGPRAGRRLGWRVRSSVAVPSAAPRRATPTRTKASPRRAKATVTTLPEVRGWLGATRGRAAPRVASQPPP